MARPPADWVAIEAAYRGGRSPVREIARTFGIHDSTLRRHAERAGWTRPPAEAPPAPPSEKPSPLPPERPRRQGREAHRAVIEQGQVLTLRLLDELLAASARIGELETLIAAATAADDDPARRAVLERAISLPRRTAALRDLAGAARLWIDLERQALGLDGKAGDEPPRIGVALRLLGPEQRAQLRRIADVLAAPRDIGDGAASRPDIGDGAASRPDIGDGAAPRPDIGEGAAPRPDIGDGVASRPAGSAPGA